MPDEWAFSLTDQRTCKPEQLPQGGLAGREGCGPAQAGAQVVHEQHLEAGVAHSNAHVL